MCSRTDDSEKARPLELCFRAVLIGDDVQVTFRREVPERFDEASL